MDRVSSLSDSLVYFSPNEQKNSSKKEQKSSEYKTFESPESIDFPHEKEFREILDFLDAHHFISNREKQEILRTLDSGDAVRLARVWMTLYPALFFIDLEFTLPLAVGIGAAAGTPVGVAAGMTMTAIQMVLANQIVHWKGRGLEKETSLSRWVMIPKVGKYVPLAYLFRDHRSFVQFLFVYQRIKKLHREKQSFNPDSPEYKVLEAKEILRIEKMIKKFAWLERQIRVLSYAVHRFGKRVHKLRTRTQNSVQNIFHPSEETAPAYS